MFYACFAALVGTNIITLVGLLMAPDISRLLGAETALVYSSYEDRIADLRIEVDRLHSRQYAQSGDINLQLQELAQQQEVLSEQHQYVKQLAEKAQQLGIATASLPIVETDQTLITGSIGKPEIKTGGAAAEIAAANDEVRAMMTDSRLALAALSEAATSQTDEIVGALASVGIKPKLPSLAGDAAGGPYLPPITDDLDSTSMVDDANAVANALARFKAARGAIALAPIHGPVVATRTSSTFGNRRDPFTGRLAFHSGIDFPAPQGTTVVSAGYGKVSFVGQISGYGNVVEVTHGGGLITRYGHLSSFIATEGQIVNAGTPIARVGSTGRSTGPHLHFEVRRADTAVNPSRYLAVGRQLRKFVAG